MKHYTSILIGIFLSLSTSQADQIQIDKDFSQIWIKFRSAEAARSMDKNIGLNEIDAARNLYKMPSQVWQKFKQTKSFKAQDILWTEYPTIILGNAQETEVTDDPKFSEQRHHDLIQTAAAWQIEQGSPEIIVAVTDNGFEINHTDLAANLWKNENEIAGNGVDDDQNGFIDDVHGWNFDANNNDPTPGEQNSHGTHVAGIIGAVKSNALGVAGIAPKVKVMPIKFYGENRWTSAIVFNSYKYAMDNGAKIINTSYNIDGFINDKIYLEALAYVKEKNGLVFNSAGNNGQKDPPRRSLSDIVLVCSTQANRLKPQLDDVISKFSNYGQGIDLCAPGDPILSTVNGQYQGQYRYGELSGTSMASPVAAAVAALIWSRNPSLTNQEVLNKLLESTDNIDEKNPRFRGLMGSGRINALKAVEAN